MNAGVLCEVFLQRDARPANAVIKAGECRVCFLFEDDTDKGAGKWHLFEVVAEHGQIQSQWATFADAEVARMYAGPPPDNPDDAPLAEELEAQEPTCPLCGGEVGP